MGRLTRGIRVHTLNKNLSVCLIGQAVLHLKRAREKGEDPFSLALLDFNKREFDEKSER
jgi:hypothetical protein